MLAPYYSLGRIDTSGGGAAWVWGRREEEVTRWGVALEKRKKGGVRE